MRVDTVTIAVPPSQRHDIIKKGKGSREPIGHPYCWPAVYALVDLLLEGKIQELRLGYPDTYGKLREQREFEDLGDDLRAVMLCDFSVVALSIHRYGGRSFDVRREDALISDYGTVLILTASDAGRQMN